MNRIIAILALALAAAFAGCTSTTKIEWGGKTAVRGPDGSVLTDANGAPYYETAKNEYKDSNWLTRREEREVEVVANADGSYTAKLGGRTNDVSENGIKMVTGGIEGLTKLVSTCAAAYTTIAGGGAQADTVATVVAKAINYFTSRGGDAAKASVTTGDGKMTISDGTTCTTCDAAGNCSDCAPADK